MCIAPPSTATRDHRPSFESRHPRRRGVRLGADPSCAHSQQPSSNSRRTMTIQASSGQLRSDLRRIGWCSPVNFRSNPKNNALLRFTYLKLGI
jgi:hypothetical protein